MCGAFVTDFMFAFLGINIDFNEILAIFWWLVHLTGFPEYLANNYIFLLK